MEKQVDKKFIWVIKNFTSIKSEIICSDSFVIGGCRWRLVAFPRGAIYFSLYIKVADTESLPYGWRRSVELSLTLVNQFSENSSVEREIFHWFKEKKTECDLIYMIPFRELHSKDSGFLVDDKLKIVAHVNVLEVIGKLDVSEEAEEASQPLKKITPTDWVDVNGFQVLSSQVDFAKRIFERHPEIASECCTKNQDLRTTHMNVLLSLIKMVVKWPQDPSTDDLSGAEASLAYMTRVGFKMDWLEDIIDQVKENKKKRALVCEMEQHLLDMEQRCKDLKTEIDKEKAILDASASDLPFSDVV